MTVDGCPKHTFSNRLLLLLLACHSPSSVATGGQKTDAANSRPWLGTSAKM